MPLALTPSSTVSPKPPVLDYQHAYRDSSLGQQQSWPTKVLALPCGVGNAIAARKQLYFMKHQNRTAQMIDQIIEPVTAQATERSQLSPRRTANPASTQAYSRYRVDEIIDQAIGKRTLLATDINSQAKVVLKLILFCPDLLAEEREQALFQQQDNPVIDNLPANLPYSVSFEAETLLGEGLVLVKPYLERHEAKKHHYPTAKPTLYSQHACSAFKVRYTPQKLEIQFPAARIREGILPSKDSTTPTQKLELWLSIVLATVVFVGGAVVLTGSILLGVATAALLPLFFCKMAISKDTRRTAILRLTHESGGRTFLSLITLLPPIKDRNGNINGAPQESTLHGSRLSVKNAKISSALMLMSGYHPLMAKLSFSFYNPTTRCPQIRIIGSCEEARWISHHLLQWSKQKDTD